MRTVNRPFVVLATHDPLLAALAGRLREWLRSFLMAACAPCELRKLPVAKPTQALQDMLQGRHWVRDQGLPKRLAHLSFLPSGWSLLRDLQPRREGRAMQKAHELICWWRVGNRITCRHSLAVELYGRFTDDAEAPTDVELNFLRSEGFMLSKKTVERDDSTFVMPGKAPDEVVSGWSVNPRVCMPKTVRTRNKRLIVAEPLSKSELCQRDRPAVYWVGKDDAALTQRVVRGWAGPLGKPAVVALELRPVVWPAGQPCAASGCDNACAGRALRGGASVGLCQATCRRSD